MGILQNIKDEVLKRSKPTQGLSAPPAGTMLTKYDGAGNKTLSIAGNNSGFVRTKASAPTGNAVSPMSDAEARFRAPVAPPAPRAALARSGMPPEVSTPAALKAPEYLGKESGLGWKTRLGIYKEQMDAFKNASNASNAANIAAMQEAGATDRTGMTTDATKYGADTSANTAREDIKAKAPLTAAQATKLNADAALDTSKQALRSKYADPNTTDAERSNIDKLWQSEQGVAEPKDVVVPGQKVQAILPGGGIQETVTPTKLINTRTGVEREATQAASSQPTETPEQRMQRYMGTDKEAEALAEYEKKFRKKFTPGAY